MSKSHLDQQRNTVRATQTPPYLLSLPIPDRPITDSDATETTTDIIPPSTEPPALRTNRLFVDIQPVSGQIYTDPTGRFLTPSISGNTDMLVLYDYDSNAILVEPMKGKSGPQILAAYKRAIALLTKRGLKPQLQ